MRCLYKCAVCNALDILRPRSLIEAKSLPVLVREWERIPNVEGLASDRCQLCGHTGFSYYQMIRHRATDTRLLIGSRCAANFWPLPGSKVLRHVVGQGLPGTGPAYLAPWRVVGQGLPGTAPAYLAPFSRLPSRLL